MSGVQSLANINISRDSLLCDQVKYWGKSNLQKSLKMSTVRPPTKETHGVYFVTLCLWQYCTMARLRGPGSTRRLHAVCQPLLPSPSPALSSDPHKCLPQVYQLPGYRYVYSLIHSCLVIRQVMQKRQIQNRKPKYMIYVYLHIWECYWYI